MAGDNALQETQRLVDTLETTPPVPDDDPNACSALPPAPLERHLHYERRRLEETTLYQLIQDQVETFLAQAETETGSGLPEFVKAEFDAFLDCGILAHGFLRLRSTDCAHEKLIAFSCKRRGFCLACGARCMAQTAAHLVDTPSRCVNAHGFSLHAAVRCAMNPRDKLERLCRYITRLAIATNPPGADLNTCSVAPWGGGQG